MNSACTSIPGSDASRAVAEISECDSERHENQKRLDEAVPQPERDADQQDRGPAPEEREQRLADAAEGDLLDHGRDDHEQHAVGRERAGVAGSQCVGVRACS